MICCKCLGNRIRCWYGFCCLFRFNYGIFALPCPPHSLILFFTIANQSEKGKWVNLWSMEIFFFVLKVKLALITFVSTKSCIMAATYIHISVPKAIRIIEFGVMYVKVCLFPSMAFCHWTEEITKQVAVLCCGNFYLICGLIWGKYSIKKKKKKKKSILQIWALNTLICE